MATVRSRNNSVTPLDYSKEQNWIINANADLNTDFDLFFFCGTSMMSTSNETGVGDAFSEMKRNGYINYVSCGSQLSENARIFCPVQRQMTLFYALDKYEIHRDLPEDISAKGPYVDLEAALNYYFEHYNPNAERPFVLAGHSQGAAALQVCLYHYFWVTEKKKYLKNMIAAYSLGYGVSRKRFASLFGEDGIIHLARGEDDYNCLLSWNTEGPGDKGPSLLLVDEEYDTYVINPLNWKTDETYAGINENCGVLLMERTGKRNRFSPSLKSEELMDAQIDLKRGSVICSTCKDYISFKTITGKDSDIELWGGKSLHVKDGSGYFNNMKMNLRLRVRKFFEAKENESEQPESLKGFPPLITDLFKNNVRSQPVPPFDTLSQSEDSHMQGDQ